jgi:hypothetical protein
MNPIATKVEITFDPEKFKTEPNNCVSYNLIYPGSENSQGLGQVPNDVLYNAGKSIQAIFVLFEAELIKRKAPYQLRSRKDRRGK